MLVALAIPATLFWPYLAAVAFLAISLLMILKDEVRQSPGLDKIMLLGRWFFALPMALPGVERFAFAQRVATGVLRRIPVRLFCAYLALVPQEHHSHA
jgi:hypothetical protein